VKIKLDKWIFAGIPKEYLRNNKRRIKIYFKG